MSNAPKCLVCRFCSSPDVKPSEMHRGGTISHIYDCIACYRYDVVIFKHLHTKKAGRRLMAGARFVKKLRAKTDSQESNSGNQDLRRY